MDLMTAVIAMIYVTPNATTDEKIVIHFFKNVYIENVLKINRVGLVNYLKDFIALLLNKVILAPWCSNLKTDEPNLITNSD